MSEDKELLGLFLARDESAAAETEKEYGELIRRVAGNILDDPRDVEECVNDTLLSLWDSIPNETPESLRAYIAIAARNTALNRNAKLKSGKRWSGKPELALHELSESLAAKEGDPFSAAVYHELVDEITVFLRSQPGEDRALFMARFFFYEEVGSISIRYGLKPNTVYSKLRKLCKKLKKHLIEKGMYHE